MGNSPRVVASREGEDDEGDDRYSAEGAPGRKSPLVSLCVDGGGSTDCGCMMTTLAEGEKERSVWRVEGREEKRKPPTLSQKRSESILGEL